MIHTDYDDLMETACFDAAGKPLPTGEMAVRIRDGLDAADAQGADWAFRVIAEDRLNGHATRARRYANEKKTITVHDGQKLATRKQIERLRRADKDTGETHYQPSFWEDLTADDLRELVELDRSRLRAARLSLDIHLKLLDLMGRHPDAVTVRDALHLDGTTIEDLVGAVA